MENLLTPTSRLVLYSLKEQPGQSLNQLREPTGTRSITTLRDAVRTLRIALKVIKNADRTYSLIDPNHPKFAVRNEQPIQEIA